MACNASVARISAAQAATVFHSSSASLRRLDYTVIGDAVNMSQRLQSVARAGQIVISEGTYQRIKESFQCQPLGEVNLKNKARPVMTYEVLA